jgi:D-galactarolactone cycloisomerase
MTSITGLRALGFEYKVQPELAYGTSRGLNFRRASAILELTTDDGIVGYGEASGPIRPIQDYLALVEGSFIGKRLYDVNLICSFVRDRFHQFGEGHYLSCLSGVNVAAYDAMGKTLRLPVHDLIGGRKVQKVPCYATAGYITRDGTAGLERQLGELDLTQFSGVKIKIGLNLKSDVERVRLARKMLGDDIFLMVDVNGNYTADIAVQCARLLEPYNIHWMEEPLPASDIAGYAELRARSPIPIATGEGLYSIHQFKALTDARGVDILQPAIGKCGGLAGLKSIATLAEIEHLRLTPAVWGGALLIGATLHFMASLPSTPHTDNEPHPCMLEFDVGANPMRDRLVGGALAPSSGCLAVPTGDGLGLKLDLDAIREFSI